MIARKDRILSWIGILFMFVLLTGMSACDSWIEHGKEWVGLKREERPVQTKPTEQKTSTKPVKYNLKVEKQLKFTTIDWINGPPPLPNQGGIFLYTAKDHPAELDNVFRYQTHNGWLVFLDRYTHSKYLGYKMQVKEVAKTSEPNLYKIVVTLSSGGNGTQSAFRFLEVGIKDLPADARIVVETEQGEVLIG